MFSRRAEANRGFGSFLSINMSDHEGKEEGHYELSCSVLPDTDWRYVTPIVARD